MALIRVERHHPEDLAAWDRLERIDRIRGRAASWPAREATAQRHIREFFEAGEPGARGYVGVSWGKDSVCLAHLARQVSPDIPLVWVKLGEYTNPLCYPVRDAFLARFPGAYEEFWGPPGEVTEIQLGAMFAGAVARYGDRHVSGIRAAESRARKLRMRSFGVSTARTCAPLTSWKGEDIFAYLCRHDLPIHPAYAFNRGGLLDRVWLRVASLGDDPGTSMGRREWEWEYYAEELERLGVPRLY